MFGYLVWHKDQCKDLTDEPNLGNVVFQTEDITVKDEEAGMLSVKVFMPDIYNEGKEQITPLQSKYILVEAVLNFCEMINDDGDVLAFTQAQIVECLEHFLRINNEEESAVSQFAYAMKDKLAKKRFEGFGGGLDKLKTTNQFLSERLRECVDKGDPIDVANFAMFIHQRGETISMIGRNPAGYLHTKTNAFVPVEGYESLLEETRKMYKPVFW